MTTLSWILLSGVLMSLLALTGALTLVLPPRRFQALVLPLVALAAGALLGGALFHMLPVSVARLGNGLTVYAWFAAGLVTFLVLEQYLHWHHCHRSAHRHRPVGYLVLIADGVHNFVGGLAVAGAFLVDVRVGVVTWLVAAAHEVPQELGDFGLLVHSGWSRRSALAYNVVSGLTFLVGSVLAYLVRGSVDVTLLVPFAAGNFLYIAVADLLPQLTAVDDARAKATSTASFVAGLGLLFVVAWTVG